LSLDEIPEPTDEDLDQGDEFPELSEEDWEALIDSYFEDELNGEW
jgi:hypothetical protein